MARNLSGYRIRAARAMHVPKLSQADLVAQLQVKYGIEMSVNTLSKLENNERYVTDVELAAFAKLLQVSTAWLLGETNDPTLK